MNKTLIVCKTYINAVSNWKMVQKVLPIDVIAKVTHCPLSILLKNGIEYEFVSEMTDQRYLKGFHGEIIYEEWVTSDPRLSSESEKD